MQQQKRKYNFVQQVVIKRLDLLKKEDKDRKDKFKILKNKLEESKI